MLLRSMQNAKRLATGAKAENDALLRDDVAAGVVVGCTSKQSVSQCIEATTASGVDNAALPGQRLPLNGIISPSERADHYAKTTGRNPEVY